MKKMILVLSFLFSLGQIQATEYEDASIEMFNEEDQMLTLDNEIEALLEDDEFEEEISIEEEVNESLQEQTTSMQVSHDDEKQIKLNEKTIEAIPIEVDTIVSQTEKLISSNPIETIKIETAKSVQAIEINLRKVFSGAPIIYTLLFFLSTISVCVWLYSMLTIRSFEFLPPKLIKDLRTKLISNQFNEALDLCIKEKHFFCKMLASGILARKHGLNIMIETMKTEGKRSTIAFWQRIGILNEIAIIAPMLGLLGTVLGMFYAFYDLNRSIESVSLLFDGLGVSVGTTVAGLIVAILAMILYSLSKYRLVRILASVENEAQTFAALIDTRGPNYLEK